MLRSVYRFINKDTHCSIVYNRRYWEEPNVHNRHIFKQIMVYSHNGIDDAANKNGIDLLVLIKSL